MLATLVRLAGGSPWLLAGAAAAALAISAASFAGGYRLGAGLRAAETERQKRVTAEVLQDIAERELADQGAELEQLRRQNQAAQRIAASAAREAVETRRQIQRLERTRHDITEIFRSRDGAGGRGLDRLRELEWPEDPAGPAAPGGAGPHPRARQ